MHGREKKLLQLLLTIIRAAGDYFSFFQLFEDALDEVPSEKLKKLKSSNKVTRKLSKFRLKEKPAKNGNGDGGQDSNSMTLSENLEEAHLAVEMFLNNNFEEARTIVQPL